MLPSPTPPPPWTMSRRFFLGSIVAAGGMVVVGCTADGDVPSEPVTIDATRPFFSPGERRTVEAIAERLIPGSDDDPGAVEAGVVDYIDGKLAGFAAFAEPAFLAGPFVDVVPDAPPGPVGVSLTVPENQLYRYGYQSGLLPQELYRRGLRHLDAFARQQFGAGFAALSADQRDQVLAALDQIQQQSDSGGRQADQGGTTQSGAEQEAGASSLVEPARAAFTDVQAGEFFDTVRTDCIEGMFADPSYGGNRDLVGWQLIGYPGYQRAYSPEEMLRGTRRKTQPLSELPSMNPDRHDERGHAVPALEQPKEGVRDG